MPEAPWPPPPEARLGGPQRRRRSPGRSLEWGRPAGPQFCERLVRWGRGRGLSLAAGLPAIDYRLAWVYMDLGSLWCSFSLPGLAQLPS